MAIENVVKLMQSAQENPELASKLETVTSSEQVVEIGAGEGLEFTTEEAETFRQKLIEMAQKVAEDGELTEDELEEASGGVIPQFLWNVATTDVKGIQHDVTYNPQRALVGMMGGTVLYDAHKASDGSLGGTFDNVVKKAFSGW